VEADKVIHRLVWTARDKVETGSAERRGYWRISLFDASEEIAFLRELSTIEACYPQKTGSYPQD